MHKVYFSGSYCVIILSIHYTTTSEIDTVGLRVSIWKIIFFFLMFCGFLKCLDVRKGHKLSYVV